MQSVAQCCSYYCCFLKRELRLFICLVLKMQKGAIESHKLRTAGTRNGALQSCIATRSWRRDAEKIPNYKSSYSSTSLQRNKHQHQDKATNTTHTHCNTCYIKTGTHTRTHTRLSTDIDIRYTLRSTHTHTHTHTHVYPQT